MTVTLKDLARAGGVSVGTVSRALNEKKEVSAETSKKIRRLAQEMGYVPNRAGRALSARKNLNSVGILLPSLCNPFFDDIKKGCLDAAAEFRDLGLDVLIRETKGWDADEHVGILKEFKEHGFKGVITCSPDHPAVVEAVHSLKFAGSPVMALNSRISSDETLCFVGPDYRRSGEMAAALMSVCRLSEPLKVLIITGFKSHQGHKERIEGFVSEMESGTRNYEIIDILEGRDNDIVTQQITMKALQEHPEINCVYMSSGAGVSGLGAALIADGTVKRLTVACDEIYTTRELVKSEIIDFVICQEPYRQGYSAVKIMHEYLSKPGSGAPEDCIAASIIKLKNHFR